ncbi:MAG: response regulator [Candidatus Delongbacteria bacterium]|nr:response regulator [Candidatus Delongbacteria bacterium]MBN2834249.1 response regulator [Candidatus Delongbacteria bacterium]
METILIADDSSTARMIIRKCLEIIGFSDSVFLEAENGREALKIIKNNSVQLICTDFNMPVMDGGIFLRWVKGSPKLKDIPVVIITSAGNPAREAELIENGAYSVIKKPVSPAVISKALNEFLK